MSIFKQQQDYLNEEAINFLLKEGRQPRKVPIDQIVEGMIGSHALGKPFFETLGLKRNMLSDPDKMNTALTELKSDLDFSYSEVSDQSERLLALSIFQESEKARLENKARSLTKLVESLEERVGSSNQGVMDSFADFSLVEFNEDPDLNQYGTTCLVDLLTGSTVLNREKVVKYDLTGNEFNMKVAKGDKQLELGKLSWLLNDNLNESWQMVLTGDAAQVQLTLDLKGIEINHIHFWGDVVGSCDLVLTLDGSPITPIFTGEHTVWEFSPIKATTLGLTLNKTAPDTVEEGVNNFVIMGRSLEVKLETYNRFETLASALLPFEPFEAVSLSASQVVPIGTTVRYLISLARTDEPYEWEYINPGETKYFDFYETKTGMAFTDAEVHPDFGVYTGIGRCYQIAHLEGSLKGLKIYKRDRWEVREKTLGDRFSLSAWLKDQGTLKGYYPINSDQLSVSSFTKATGYIYCEKAQRISEVSFPGDGVETEFYLNSNPVQTFRIVGTTKHYNITLRKGWNKIDVIGKGAGTMNLSSGGSRLCAYGKFYTDMTPLNRTNMHDLCYNIPPRDYSCYAIDNNGNIVVNYNPGNLCYEYNVRVLNISKVNNLLGLRVMAQMESETKKVTPRILRYSLTLS